MQHIWNAKETPVHKEDIDVIWQRVKAKIDLEIQREKQKTQKSLWSFDLSHILPQLFRSYQTNPAVCDCIYYYSHGLIFYFQQRRAKNKNRERTISDYFY